MYINLSISSDGGQTHESDASLRRDACHSV